MLIKCPECQKEVSDQAEVCIHCGFPLKKVPQNEAESPSTKKLSIQRCLKCRKVYPITDAACPACGTPSGQKPDEAPMPASEEPKILCPTCKSSYVEKISTTSKVVSVVAFGIFSNKRSKTFKCKRCGYMW